MVSCGSVATVTATGIITVPVLLVAVKTYVVVIVGFTEMLVLVKTLPTLLSMLKLVGVPPDKLHDKVADWPFAMLAGVAVKLAIVGGN